MILLVYLATYLTAWGLTSGIAALSPGLAKTVNTLIWGFNFIIGSALAILLRVLLERGKRSGLIRRQYQNNYLLNRLSGFFFDVMIVAGIASINLEDLPPSTLRTSAACGCRLSCWSSSAPPPPGFISALSAGRSIPITIMKA